jgi:hypothetical protein
MPVEIRDYCSYLLRLWRVRDNGERWRAALERVEDGERRGFENLEALFAYLSQVCAPGKEISQDRDEDIR